MGAPEASGTCFLFSFLESDLPNRPATKLFLRLATLMFSGLSTTGGLSSALVGGVTSPVGGEALIFENDCQVCVSVPQACPRLWSPPAVDCSP